MDNGYIPIYCKTVQGSKLLAKFVKAKDLANSKKLKRELKRLCVKCDSSVYMDYNGEEYAIFKKGDLI